jgi:hypothetical protein
MMYEVYFGNICADKMSAQVYRGTRDHAELREIQTYRTLKILPNKKNNNKDVPRGYILIIKLSFHYQNHLLIAQQEHVWGDGGRLNPSD